MCRQDAKQFQRPTDFESRYHLSYVNIKIKLNDNYLMETKAKTGNFRNETKNHTEKCKLTCWKTQSDLNIKEQLASVA